MSTENRLNKVTIRFTGKELKTLEKHLLKNKNVY